MEFHASAALYREQINRISYYLMRSQGTAYGIFLQRIVPETSPQPINGRFPIAIGMNKLGQVRMRMHWPSIEQLPLSAQAELFKHELLHIIFGHLSSRRVRMIERFGYETFGMAADLVVNQYINVAIMQEHGFAPLTIEAFKFPKDMTTEWYCEALSKPDEEAVAIHTDGEWLRPSMADRAGEAKANYAAAASLQHMTLVASGDPAPPLKFTSPAPYEAVDMTELDESLTDLMVDKLLEDVKTETKTLLPNGASGFGRGWDANEAKEWIAQLRRPPTIPWFSNLRTLEARFRTTERVPTVNRPSRRCPEHMGRAKRSSLFVWFGIDTSGSMGADRLSVVEAEVKGLHDRGASIYMLQLDADIHSREIYRPNRRLIEFAGRGGTDFSPFMFEVSQARGEMRPDFVMFYTDGYGCLSNYIQAEQKTKGMDWWNSFIKTNPTRTPNGVECLWLLAEGTTSPAEFRRIAPFGRIGVIPAPGKSLQPAR